MPKFTVTMKLSYEKELTIYADDEELAEEKAENIVSDWNNVDDFEVIRILED